jgi:hypothetical protein
MQSVFGEVGKRYLNTVSKNFSVKVEPLHDSRVVRQENMVMGRVRLGNRSHCIVEDQQ